MKYLLGLIAIWYIVGLGIVSWRYFEEYKTCKVYRLKYNLSKEDVFYGILIFAILWPFFL